MKIEKAKSGTVGLVMETPDGRIIQLGLTTDQSAMLNTFVASMSSEKALPDLGKDYELIPAWQSQHSKEAIEELCRYLEDAAKTLEELGYTVTPSLYRKAIQKHQPPIY